MDVRYGTFWPYAAAGVYVDSQGSLNFTVDFPWVAVVVILCYADIDVLYRCQSGLKDYVLREVVV
jgi:hypothetical protein